MLFLSIASVGGMYLFGKELYNKKVGLIASFLMSIFYLNLFFTYRLLGDIPSLTFFIFSGFLFYKYFKAKSKKALYLATILIAIGTLLKLSTAFILPAILVYALITGGFKIFKRKEVWISALIFILILSPYIIWGYLEFGGFVLWISALIFILILSPYIIWGYLEFGGFVLTQATSHVAPGSYFVGFNIMKNYLAMFPTYFSWLLLATFVLGLALMYKIFLYFDRLVKGDKKLSRDLFLLLILLVPFVLVSFLIGHNENRYLITVFPTVFLISGSFIMLAYNRIKKKTKVVAVIFLICLLTFITVFQLQSTDSLIRSKVDTYLDVKEAGLWLNQNSDVTDIVLNFLCFLYLKIILSGHTHTLSRKI
jgi:4-amino-4-deoxy-L-arabinose transferase-like glycosyltransferase